VDTTALELPPRFDPTDPDVRDDPYPAYARLRAAGPLCRGGPGQWVVTRHADVAPLLSDARMSNRFPPEYVRFSVGDGAAGAFLQRIMLHADRPRHTRLRRLVGAAFSAAGVSALHDRVVRMVDCLLDGVRERGGLDVVDDLAFPLPIMVICELLGIPPSDRDEIRPRARALGRAFATRVAAADRAAADASVTWLRGYLDGLLADRGRQGSDDLLSRMLTARDGGESLTREEVVDNAVFLFFAGFETTTSLIATGCATLLHEPAQLASLQADPSLVPSAVEELLRYDAPIQSRLRVARAPIVVGGRTVRPGRLLLLLIGSANRDERRFADPGRLNVARYPNPHLSFGGGIHHCLGAALARLEAAVVLDRLLHRFCALELAGEPERDPGAAFRTYAHVPVAVRASVR
jgi:cytochrome P450